MCPWKKKHFLQLCFIAFTKSERELSSLLKRARTEAGLALAGPLETDKMFLSSILNTNKKSLFFFCSVKQLSSKGEMESAKIGSASVGLGRNA